MDWRILILGTILAWGVQGIFNKVIVSKAGGLRAVFFTILGFLITNFCLVWILLPNAGKFSSELLVLGLLIGITGALGFVCLQLALEKGPVSVVAPASQLFLVVTVIGGVVLLGEKLTISKLVGILLVLVGGILLAL